jgi:peptidoglycan/xylan/chitin deacetylase (PgdA/CDA1 family)
MTNAPRITRRGFILGGSALAGIVVVNGCSSSKNSGSAVTTLPLVPVGTSTTLLLPPAATSNGAVVTTSVGATSAPAAGAAVYVNHGDAALNKVALTFHLGGDAALVTKLLDLMKSKSFTATFFAIGSWLQANPTLGHRAVAEGHELANHTLNHKNMGDLTRSQVYDEIAGGGQALVPFIGSIGKWFRPSGTDVPSQLILDEAGRAGYAVSVGYDVDSRDFKEPGSKAVITKVNTEAHAGSIVSMHFGHTDTIKALPAILDHLAALGLTQATVSNLLG